MFGLLALVILAVLAIAGIVLLCLATVVQGLQESHAQSYKEYREEGLTHNQAAFWTSMSIPLFPVAMLLYIFRPAILVWWRGCIWLDKLGERLIPVAMQEAWHKSKTYARGKHLCDTHQEVRIFQPPYLCNIQRSLIYNIGLHVIMPSLLISLLVAIWVGWFIFAILDYSYCALFISTHPACHVPFNLLTYWPAINPFGAW